MRPEKNWQSTSTLLQAYPVGDPLVLLSYISAQLRTVAKIASPIFNNLHTLSLALLHSQNGKAIVFSSLRTLWPKTPGWGG
jgi:hypothetical protein